MINGNWRNSDNIHQEENQRIYVTKVSTICRLVPDYTVQKGTIKRHKTYEKSTYLDVHIPQSMHIY